MNCERCSYTDYQLKYVIYGYRMLECKKCKHLMTDLKQIKDSVDEIYSDEYFFGGKTGYPNYNLNETLLINQGKYYAKKMRKYVNKGSLLDVGSAAGFIMKGFQQDGWNVQGIEPNEQMVKYGNKVLGVPIDCGTLEEYRPDQKFDLISLIQVIAHVRDLNRALNQISELTNKEGFVLIETWNKDSFTAKLFGTNWHEFSPPSTLHYFSKGTLNYFMQLNGFDLIATGRPRKRILGAHAKELIRHKIEKSKNLKCFQGLIKLIPEKLILPYPSEDLFWALYQKQNN